MSSSVAGRAPDAAGVRIKRSLAGPANSPGAFPGNDGFHCDAGATEDAGKNLRGPVRRSYKGAIALRQFPAACSRSEGVRSNCTSFSASAKVAAETGGPTSGAVPKAGGDPGGRLDALCCGLRHAANAALKAMDARFRNRRREFGMPYCSRPGGPTLRIPMI